MLEFHEVLPRRDLRVVVNVAEVVHRNGLDTRLLQDGCDLLARPRARPGPDRGLDLVDPREARVEMVETRVVDTDDRREARPLVVGPRRDRDPAIVAGAQERAVRDRARRSVPVAHADHAALRVVEDPRRERPDTGLDL
jgi:hypothetical protein